MWKTDEGDEFCKNEEVLKQRRNPPEEGPEMKLTIDRVDDNSSKRALKQRINGSRNKGRRATLLAEAKDVDQGTISKMRKLNKGELLGIRMRTIWNLIAEEEPGPGNCAVPLALLALARWEAVSEDWLTFLAQVYGVAILIIVDEWVESGSVQKSTDDEGTWYRLGIFPKGYEKLLTLVANEEPGMYRRALDRTQGRVIPKASMGEVVKQAAANWRLKPEFPSRRSKEDLAGLKKSFHRK